MRSEAIITVITHPHQRGNSMRENARIYIEPLNVIIKRESSQSGYLSTILAPSLITLRRPAHYERTL